MMTRQEAQKILETTAFPKVDLTETELMKALYLHENEKSFSIEKTVFDITRANFAVFGAVMLLQQTSFFAGLYGGRQATYVALCVIGLVSLAASVMVTLNHKYLLAHRQKVSILQRGIWRQRPLGWLELKYEESELVKQFGKTARLGPFEYVTHSYTMKYINLIPLVVAVGGAVFLQR